ncbi:GNAT family N-acetyltransferase [Rubripirellula amarantea]|nr:GNAT family N-acetyltransferase [Rubripirellula amarantea]
MSVTLFPIQVDGSAEDFTGALPGLAVSITEYTSAMYAKSGFVLPWIGYLAARSSTIVGTCGFKSPPDNNSVEIAYFTFPRHEGDGVATAMARELVQIAASEAPGILITAQTLVQRNASHRILEKLGFVAHSPTDHPEDGTVLVWHRNT